MCIRDRDIASLQQSGLDENAANSLAAVEFHKKNNDELWKMENSMAVDIKKISFSPNHPEPSNKNKIQLFNDNNISLLPTSKS